MVAVEEIDNLSINLIPHINLDHDIRAIAAWV
jgi:hypothetical protein